MLNDDTFCENFVDSDLSIIKKYIRPYVYNLFIVFSNVDNCNELKTNSLLGLGYEYSPLTFCLTQMRISGAILIILIMFFF